MAVQVRDAAAPRAPRPPRRANRLRALTDRRRESSPATRKTGEAVWFYQWSPHDLHDYDGVNESILIDLEWQGQPRKTLIHPDRNGYLYLLDRLTGEVLYAKPFVPITTSTGVDLETGRLSYNPDTAEQVGRVTRGICPASPGGKGLAALGLLAEDGAALHPS